MTAYLAIDAGGSFLKSAVLTGSGRVLGGTLRSIPSCSDGSRSASLQAFEQTIRAAVDSVGVDGAHLGGIGIAFPGPFDCNRATPLMKHKFRELYGLDLRAHFYRTLCIPKHIPIRFIHDSNAVLSGELWKGNARGFADAAVVTLGTGLGFAIAEKGQVLRNDLGGPRISIFSIPYKDGILEDYTSKRGILRAYQELGKRDDVGGITVAEIGAKADEGDSTSRSAFERVGTILAEALREILDNRKIGCLLFGGQISRSFRHMEPALTRGLSGLDRLSVIAQVKEIDLAALWGAIGTVAGSR